MSTKMDSLLLAYAEAAGNRDECGQAALIAGLSLSPIKCARLAVAWVCFGAAAASIGNRIDAEHKAHERRVDALMAMAEDVRNHAN